MRPSTFEKWAADTPDTFRFSVKMHRLITHYTRLKNTTLLDNFFGPMAGLGDKLAVVLIQLPPSLAFDATVAGDFFTALRKRYDGFTVCEPRHASWRENDALRLLADHEIGPVLVDIPDRKSVLGVKSLPVYVRLHGKPRRYYSSYSAKQLQQLASFLRCQTKRSCFVVFDNTVGDAAVLNALDLQRLLARKPRSA